ncbi:hypothetical protein HVA01_26210 [Halovibrio variabilis]|uniref:DUF2511 domain-containing protein n=1 Tax=Halovibrio variabilis TaxID=31910 RepID=A0A511UQW9_9GAMM|nr:DUF2511 domain-containing protein [Halovibrio variabilis]GEN28975.1 hypothetical protein HVA01_26210 [Halovibrio variabilis]
MNIRTTLIVVILFALSGCGQSSSSGLEVSKGEFGESWPFTVESGVVDCVDGQAAIFKTGGTSYQLNGFARSSGYAPIDPIWRENPEIPGVRVNIGSMIDLALEQC